MATVYRIYTANQVKQLESEAYRVLMEMCGATSSDADPVITGVGDFVVGQGIGYIAKDTDEEEGTIVLDLFSAYLSCLEDMSLAIVAETHDLWRQARILTNEKGYDRIKFEIKEVRRYIQPKKGWPGGYIYVQDGPPAIYAVHSETGLMTKTTLYDNII